jgi:hypothetical protein
MELDNDLNSALSKALILAKSRMEAHYVEERNLQNKSGLANVYTVKPSDNCFR